MNISLKKAEIRDCEQIYKMRMLGFKALLDKYQGFETNPGNETLERIKWRFLTWGRNFVRLENKS